MNGNYSYSNLINPAVLPSYCPDFDILTPELKDLFIRTFEKGANQPEVRPSPSEFINALSAYVDDLTLCNCSKQGHYIRKGYQFGNCEWCRIEKIMEKQATHHDESDDLDEWVW
jgi:DNA-binding helix-hairpin-helix protein with protein kinase domain